MSLRGLHDDGYMCSDPNCGLNHRAPGEDRPKVKEGEGTHSGQELDATELMLARIQLLSDEFSEYCHQRHLVGAQDHGAIKFLEVDTIEEALAEIADLSNYARYTYIKLRLLQESLEPLVPSQPIPTTGFIKSSTFSSLRGDRS